MVMFVARESDDGVTGFVALKQHNPFTFEIYVMGVVPQYHGLGIGTALIKKAEEYLSEKNVKFLQVKTLGANRSCKEYALTRAFYASVGFYPIEEFKEFWDKDNPGLLMIKSIS